MRLEISGLHVAYGPTEVLFGVDLTVPDGSLTCLMGRNGVGKSTLVNTVAGLMGTRRGGITLDGRDVTRMAAPKRAKAGIGYVPQGHQVFPHLTTEENLLVVWERDRRRERAALDDALDVFPALRPLLQRPAGLLSGGQAQQLAIARALVARPKLLILDEPTEGIQPSIIAEIEDCIARLHAEMGLSILLIEQYVEFALRLADHYAIMDGGLISHEGSTVDVDPSIFGELLGV